jgi:hypothetical protein
MCDHRQELRNRIVRLDHHSDNAASCSVARVRAVMATDAPHTTGQKATSKF